MVKEITESSELTTALDENDVVVVDYSMLLLLMT